MTSNRPYLLRAFYEWIVDNQTTPYIVVDATVPGVQVPGEYVKDGQIVLNIAPSACGKLQMGNDEISFEARFNSSARQLTVPCHAVVAIYARENGAGTVFDVEDELQDPGEDPVDEEMLDGADVESGEDEKRPKGRPHLTVVK